MEPKAITSRDNPLLVRLRKLVADPAGYRRAGEVWIEGEHLCAAHAQRGGAASQAVITESATSLRKRTSSGLSRDVTDLT